VQGYEIEFIDITNGITVGELMLADACLS
jgi:hypothetical protein